MNLARIGLAVVAVSGLAGCSGTTAPSTASVTPASPPPAAAPPPGTGVGLQPTIATISPNVVSTDGTWGTIIGTQFQPGATLTIGGSPVVVVFRDSSRIQFSHSGAHAPGAVDVTITNPGARPVTVSGGYTYAPSESFDMNGEWIAHADGRGDFTTDMHFTIKGNALVGVSCGTPVAMPTRVSAPSGRFSFAGVDGLALSGTLVSATTASGDVSAPGCGDGKWWADKAPSQG